MWRKLKARFEDKDAGAHESENINKEVTCGMHREREGKESYKWNKGEAAERWKETEDVIENEGEETDEGLRRNIRLVY